MNKSSKLYKKAVSFYSKGSIDKALTYCEKSISENIKNSSAINLKGLLFYFKGELEGAQALWKMNYQVNRDMVSKKYLEDTSEDEDKKLIYKAAAMAIKELKLREAVRLLQKCRESDFNCINVHNSMAICYIKLGEYDNALKHIEEVFKIDSKNAAALKSKKEMLQLGVIKSKHNIMPIIAICVLGIGIGIALIGFYSIRQYTEYKDFKRQQSKLSSPAASKTTDVKKSADDNNEKNPSNTDEKKNDPNAASQKPEAEVQNVFPIDALNKAMTDKDYDTLYSIVQKWQSSTLDINSKSMLQKAIELLKTDGTQYFYSKGTEAIKGNDYNTAQKYLTMAYSYGKDYYLYQDILYMLGYSYKNDNVIDSCIKYYEEYDSKFPKGTYEETVLYDLALIYKPIDIKASKNYASKLIAQYPKSIYNNSVINGIIGS